LRGAHGYAELTATVTYTYVFSPGGFGHKPPVRHDQKDLVPIGEDRGPQLLPHTPPSLRGLVSVPVSASEAPDASMSFAEMEIESLAITARGMLVIKLKDGSVDRVLLPAEALEKDLLIQDKRGRQWLVKKDHTIVQGSTGSNAGAGSPEGSNNPAGAPSPSPSPLKEGTP